MPRGRALERDVLPAKTSANFDFTLKDAGGATVKLSDYKGKVVLLNFWATWCGPCKMEIPEFVEAYSKYRDRGFVILGVLSEDDPPQKDLQAFMSEFKMNYPVMRQHAELEESFGDAVGAAHVVCHRPQGAGVLEAHRGPSARKPSSGRSTDSCSMIAFKMLKGFTHARLACGCRIGFREGVEGSPVTVVIEQKGPGCPLALHVRDLPLFDHREALRPSTRLLPPIEEDYEES